ncbi:MAG: SH3 domain-containing protein [Proteobacteria bacterium]|nr:SH3 domain-containing protein [Pseudomonadota bacterium]
MAAGTAKVTARDGLNVRKGPGTSNKKIGALSNGQTVQFYSETQGWLQISYAGQTGYISKQYTSITQGSTGGGNSGGNAGSGNSASSASGQVRITASALNVRAGAGTNYKVLGSLSNGKVVSYSGESNGWLKISYNGSTGWISKKYTASTSGSNNAGGGNSTSDNAGGSTKTMYVTARDGLNVRTGAGQGYTKLGTLSNGASVSVYKTSGNWAQIKYGSGTGWVCSDYLSSSKQSSGGNGGGGGGSAPSGTNPAEYATNYLFSKTGLYTHDFIKHSPKLPNLTDLSVYGSTYNYGYDCNCANFVTACSQNVGWLSKHFDGVSSMYSSLKNGYGYRKISGSQAKKGDIWCNTSLGHTELVYSNNGSTITLIGSNNENTNKQRVTFATKSRDSGYYLSRQ